MWETCAPGHGKGPWDGIGAVVKRFLRLLETQGKTYMQGARDVFLAVLEHDAAGERKATSTAVLARFVYHYILTATEPSLGDAQNVWSSVRRPTTKPNCTPVSGIRSSFCFRVAAAGVLALRELSCRCKSCLEMRWADCTNADAGPWRYLTMQSTAAVAGAKTRGQRQTVSEQRRKLAKGLVEGQVFALESADDAEGFSFWLAVAQGASFTYSGDKKTEDGVVFTRGGQYINLRYYERFPPSSPTVFKLSPELRTVDAEGVIATQVRFSDCQIRRSSRRQAPTTCPALITISDETRRALAEHPRLDEM
jgi:hypothetical protein